MGVRVRKIRNGKSACKDEVTGEIVKSWGELVIIWIWKLCTIAFKIV